MRLSIVLAICFLGVASASNFFDIFQNKSQEALHNLEHFGEDFQQKLQDALGNLFGKHNETENTVTVVKRDIAADSLQLINSIGDPVKFTQQLVKVLAEMAFQGRRKRDITEDLKKIAAAGKEKTQEALEKILSYFNSFNNGGSEQATPEVTVVKRDIAADSLQLINSLGDPAKFAQQLLKVLGEMALQGRRKRDIAADSLQLINSLGDPAKFAQQFAKVIAEMALQGRRKRDISEDLKKIAEVGKEKAQEALKKIMDMFNSFKNGGAEQTATEVTVVKRDIAADSLQLINSLGDPAKFAQQLVKVLGEMALQGRRKRDLSEDLKKFAEAGKQKAQDALKKIMDLFGSFKRPASDETSTEKTVSKRDVSEDLQKIASAGKEKVQAALKQLQSLFDQIKEGFNHDESSQTVTKRDISESLKEFGHVAQEKTQSAFQHLKDAFDNFFKGFKKPTKEVVEVEEAEEEVSTEVSVSKRSLNDFQQKAQEALSGFGATIQNFFNNFRKPTKPVAEVADVAEDTTESS